MPAGLGPRLPDFASGFYTMRGPKFCSMEITRAVRDHAANFAEAERQKGMAEMSAKFRAMGGDVYVEES